MADEKLLKQEIMDKVKEIYKLRKAKETFVKGKTRIGYSGRCFDEKEMLAAVDAVLDFWLTLGPKGIEFCESFKNYLGNKHCLVTNSGSSSNLLAISALCSDSIANPIRPWDEVITTAVTFPTTLNPIIQNKLTPVFVDIEEDTYNIDASLIEAAVSSKTRAIVFAHTLGNPAEMDKIMAIAKKYKLYVVEDTCDALDSIYEGKYCGSFGDFSTFSFYAAHHITMGEGGALCTNSSELYRAALSYRDWGRACYCQTGEKNPNGACGHRFDFKFKGLPEGYDHKYVYSNIGYNLKPLDIQCAIGLEQLKKLPDFTKARKKNFNLLYDFMKKYEDKFILPRSLPKADASWFAFPLTIREDAGFTKKALVTFLESKNIETRMLFAGNILNQPGYKNINHRISGQLTNSDQVLHKTFFLGVYPGITQEKLEYITDCIDEFFK
ncbi:lipopolysaccharide biosynthesis protein RfbH [Clostridium swellfunianum]|uniref:lipopolysaccharide biosynthesis protein RfbH n=1 Tax=Clostridium swellfunianum TaxID=1367462 RepID=UPI00202E5926|nr:lipopolysaccharide biosynthesis protein RfbH [Clostridium swellfunianum]MCM0647378.1 lipopolysaccharide biosynthesis protein RfbH [Clostridium swellfunianum]